MFNRHKFLVWIGSMRKSACQPYGVTNTHSCTVRRSRFFVGFGFYQNASETIIFMISRSRFFFLAKINQRKWIMPEVSRSDLGTTLKWEWKYSLINIYTAACSSCNARLSCGEDNMRCQTCFRYECHFFRFKASS